MMKPPGFFLSMYNRLSKLSLDGSFNEFTSKISALFYVCLLQSRGKDPSALPRLWKVHAGAGHSVFLVLPLALRWVSAQAHPDSPSPRIVNNTLRASFHVSLLLQAFAHMALFGRSRVLEVMLFQPFEPQCSVCPLKCSVLCYTQLSTCFHQHIWCRNLVSQS